MPVQTYIDQARTRVQAEQDAVDEMRDAYDAFIRRVTELQPDPSPAPTAGLTTTVGTQLAVDAATDDQCGTVRTAFAETIHPHSVVDIDESESLLETIREEFTDAIAVALATTTETSFTPDLKRMIIAEAQSRRSEVTALRKTLDREDAHLEKASTAVDEITTWIADADETPLTDLRFNALARRHDRLATHRDRCTELARGRQQFLQRATNNGIETGVRHRSLVPYLYQDFPVDHPVLATVATLDDTCADCQRVVRAHLIRRA
ncbi:MAG: hypothetical protein V5A55_13835 [Halovenus sp.]